VCRPSRRLGPSGSLWRITSANCQRGATRLPTKGARGAALAWASERAARGLEPAFSFRPSVLPLASNIPSGHSLHESSTRATGSARATDPRPDPEVLRFPEGPLSRSQSLTQQRFGPLQCEICSCSGHADVLASYRLLPLRGARSVSLGQVLRAVLRGGPGRGHGEPPTRRELDVDGKFKSRAAFPPPPAGFGPVPSLGGPGLRECLIQLRRRGLRGP
jgi:hypothetical protein